MLCWFMKESLRQRWEGVLQRGSAHSRQAEERRHRVWFSTTPSTKAVRLAFYSNGACTPEDEFYDFYKGELAHAPDGESFNHYNFIPEKLKKKLMRVRGN